MFLADENDPTDLSSLNFYIGMASQMIKEMFGVVSSFVSTASSIVAIKASLADVLASASGTAGAAAATLFLSMPSVLYVQTWELYRFKYWEKNKLNEDWSAYLKMCSEKCLKPQENHEDHVSSLSSIFGKYFLIQPFLQTLQALRDKLKDGTFEEPLTDEELIRISASGLLRAEKSM